MPLTGEKKKEYEREYKRKKRGMTKEPVIPSHTECHTRIKELETEIVALRDEVSRLKQLLAQRPVETRPIHTPMPQKFAGSFSRESQGKGSMPNNGPLGRMYRGEDNW